jgi:polar amino acid transport system substrate-binding protein
MTFARRHRRQLITAATAVAAIALWLAFWPAGTSRNATAPPARPVAKASAHHAKVSAAPACDPTASLRPSGPPTVTPGSFMATIRKRGYLIAGVDQSTYHFGYLDPLDGKFEGFDIDMLHAISAAIFGNPNKIRYVAISDAQRVPAVQSGEVDIVAHTMTINCDRLRYVDFSTVYFNAAQRVLVLRTFNATNDQQPPPYALAATAALADVLTYHGNVCATSTSTSIANIRAEAMLTPGTGRAVAVPNWTDCLVLLQQGAVAGISTDDSILAGLEAQDPDTKIIGLAFSPQPYGLAISKQHPDFVRFVNAVLAQMRADGQWAAIYKRWVGTPVPAPPPARYLR